MRKLLGLLLISSACFAQTKDLSLAKVTCKTCAVALVKPQHHRLVRTLEFVAPVGVAFGIGMALNSTKPLVPIQQKLTIVPIHDNPSFCIIGKNC